MAGTGFFIDAQGTILTNARVIEDADGIGVGLADGARYPATLLGRDALTDLAVLRVPPLPHALTAFSLRPAAGLQAGESVIALGPPRGPVYEVSTSSTIRVKGRHQAGAPPAFADLIQTDTPLPPAYAGGPLLDADGNVIGIVTLLPAGQPGTPADAGFAVPVDAALDVLPTLLKTGRVVRGWLGLAVYPLGRDPARSSSASEGQGALIRAVVENGPAAKAGLKAGDVVLAVDDRPLREHGELGAITALRAPGDTLKLRVQRGQTEEVIEASLGTRPDEVARREPVLEDPPPPLPSHGLLLRDPTPGASLREPSRGAAVAEVEVGSPGDRSGIHPGDLIIGVGEEAIESVRGLEAALTRAARPARLRLLRAGTAVSLELRLDPK